ncbi:hypothetical protein SAMN05518865_10864 [Duganella sp. CF458]|uniref:hypothetical protein n=1 Tax=Duganella sp. CF458 TaxID=1884368 RepID=UPI0008EC3773|nr:hypothetical protein [Duganella sp. CF458]SFG08530.1 hypothetical protein SAMN05518865_10864 [Duganella sp. CF458]
MKILYVALASLFFTASHSAVGQNNSSCTAIVKSAQDAASRADWVIEGDVNNTFKMNSTPGRIDVSIENAKVVFESEKSPKFFTAVLQTDSCFPNAITTLWGKPADKIIGKRMRFYGTKLTSGRGRRFFFMQPAEQAMPSMPVTRKEYADKKYPHDALTATQDGWSRVRSTDGHFSIEMPGSFEDITKGSGEQPAFMLRGTDRYGSTFLAVFERSGPGSGMGGTFDSTITKPDAKTLTFKGADAVSTLGEIPGSNGEKVTHGLWFRVPGGTFMLGVVTDKDQKESLKFQERFFNSLTFE